MIEGGCFPESLRKGAAFAEIVRSALSGRGGLEACQDEILVFARRH